MHDLDTSLLHPLRRRFADRAQLLSRRQFVQLVAASVATSAAGGCQPDPPEQIMPYVRRPPDTLPGKSSHYATSWLHDGYATGLIVTTRGGRPIKVEGNPAHPSSLGATSHFHQAAVLQLYDPDRARTALHRGLPAAVSDIITRLRVMRSDAGAGLALLLEPTSSPLIHAQVQALKQRYPRCSVTWYAPNQDRYASEVSQTLFGRELSAQLDLSTPDVIAVFDAALLSAPHHLGYARAFAARRHVATLGADMNRLYAVEPAPSVTGGMADHRLARTAQRVGFIVAALSVRILPQAIEPGEANEVWNRLDAEEQRFVEALARDLLGRARGRSLLVAGQRQPAPVQALCHLMNAQLGNLDSTLSYTTPALPLGPGDRDLSELTDAMHNGEVDTLLTCGVNPAYDAPADLDWARAADKVQERIYAGLYQNESAQRSTWFVPLLHPFESWGDARAYDGTYSLVQPLIRPLRAGTTLSELLGALSDEPQVSDRARLRVRFGQDRGEAISLQQSAAERAAQQRPDVDEEFALALARGFVEGSALARVEVTPNFQAAAPALRTLLAQQPWEHAEINFVPSPTLHDGRFANLSWLLELPEPTTKLTWDNAALMSPQTAARLGVPQQPVGDDDSYPLVELSRRGRSLRVPVLLMPGHADDSITLWLGYGREGAEQLASGVGVSAYLLRTQGAEHFAGDLQVSATNQRYPLAITQLHRDQHHRPLALTRTLAEYRAEPDFAAEHKGPLPSFMPTYDLPGPQWAMTIDMGMCSGCSACMVACQAENNLLVVGKEQVRRGRVMHWIRVDVYNQPGSDSRIVHQPMLCQHCENAPCEYVCPVNATEHSPDGLNEMVYNRCVGTRFCSNNCPYKVRRFNWLNWQTHGTGNTGSVMLQRNPEVSVRDRGVMEKCSYCVQRIRAAEIAARIAHTDIRPGEVQTACQQVCPTGAIRFDSLTHKASDMVRWREQPRSYAVLHETGARPRTHYLARIDNRNPELL